MGLGERSEGQDLASGCVHEWACFGEAGRELGGDLVPSVGHRVGVRLREDGPEQRGGHVLVQTIPTRAGN